MQGQLAEGGESWKPNLFVPGFPKCGTTALCDYLRQNPEVYVMEPKEPNTLVVGEQMPSWGPKHRRLMRPYYSVLDFGAYRRQFEEHADTPVRAEGSQNYVWPPRFPAKLKRFAPDAKLIFMIRDQKERLVSTYFYFYLDHGEPDFAKWVNERFMPDLDRFLFTEKLASFHREFGDSMRVIGNRALQRSPQRTMDEVFGFLGVPGSTIHPLLSKVGEWKPLTPGQRKRRAHRMRMMQTARRPTTYFWNAVDPARSSRFLRSAFGLHPLRKLGVKPDSGRPVQKRQSSAVREEEMIPGELSSRLDEDYANALGYCRERGLMLADGKSP